jgi:hypothetical protein
MATIATGPYAAAPRVRAPDKGLFASRFGPVYVHAVVATLVACVHWFSEEPSTTLQVAGSLVCAGYLFIAVLEARRAPALLSPLSFYFLWYSLSLGAAAVHFGNLLEEVSVIRFGMASVDPDELLGGYVVYVIGSLAIHAGIQISRPLVEETPSAPRLGSGFFLLWAISVGSRLAATRLVTLGGLVSITMWGSLAALSAFVLTRGSLFRKASFWIVLGLGTAIELAMNLRTGSKAYLMFSFLPIGLLFIHTPRLRPWVPVFATAMTVLYLGVVAPVISASRFESQNVGESKTDLVLRTYDKGDYAADGGLTPVEQAAAFFERAFEPVPAGFIYGEVERDGYRWGETMVYLAYAFVPRIFWPDKPSVSRGAWFYAYTGSARNEAEATTALAQTATGELYWNFGFGGVGLGMGLIGLCFGLLWRLATVFPERDPVRALLYFTLIFNMIDMSEAGTVIVSIVFRCVVLVPTILLFDRIVKHAEQKRGRA